QGTPIPKITAKNTRRTIIATIRHTVCTPRLGFASELLAQRSMVLNSPIGIQNYSPPLSPRNLAARRSGVICGRRQSDVAGTTPDNASLTGSINSRAQDEDHDDDGANEKCKENVSPEPIRRRFRSGLLATQKSEHE